MQEGPHPKQQIVEKLKTSTNILVTVSANPSVDELSAALGFTLMLNKMDKHATAVFSGKIPPAIEFLDPEKTFEDSVDSLRDFIIALDKEKADRLRYKVDGDMVRIFITPYRTTITDKDLQFSQGDFNIEVIVALGVEQREELDKAIAAHGRILHDATVITVNAKNERSSLGAIDWQDINASSLCEMLMSLSEALQPGLLDEQVATALLTGIVAATERFSNQHTSPRVMTMAAQLMAAGANQQLIATKLQQAHEIPATNQDGSTTLPENASTKLKKEKPKKKADGEMQVEHKKGAEVTEEVAAAAQTTEEKKQKDALDAAEDALANVLPAEKSATKGSPSLSDLEADLKKEREALDKAAEELDVASQPAAKPDRKQAEKPSWMGKRIEPPTMGGSLSATSEDALRDKLTAEQEDRNRTILSHDKPAQKVAQKPAKTEQIDKSAEIELKEAPRAVPEKKEVASSAPAPVSEPEVPAADMESLKQAAASLATPATDLPAPAVAPAPTPPLTVPSFDPQLAPPAPSPVAEAATPSLADQLPPIAEPAPQIDINGARDAVSAALNAQPFDPSGQPLEGVGAQPLSPVASAPISVPNLATSLPVSEPTPPLLENAPTDTPQFDTVPSMPTPPPLPDMNGLPPFPSLPPLPDGGQLPPVLPGQPSTPPADPFGPPPMPQTGNDPAANPNDPAQFKIPGQP